MSIIEYDKKYDENIKDLLVELQEYIVSIDKEKYNIMTDLYREENFKDTMEELLSQNGKIFLAVEDDNMVGLIMGLINNEEESTYDFKAPKRGRVTELIVSSKSRSKGIGKMLLKTMENYFKEMGCKALLIEVFGYNDKGRNFYNNNGYLERNVEVMKVL